MREYSEIYRLLNKRGETVLASQIAKLVDTDSVFGAVDADSVYGFFQDIELEEKPSVVSDLGVVSRHLMDAISVLEKSVNSLNHSRDANDNDFVFKVSESLVQLKDILNSIKSYALAAERKER